jgi:hypothetical protein
MRLCLVVLDRGDGQEIGFYVQNNECLINLSA